jgi:hypothetical protein
MVCQRHFNMHGADAEPGLRESEDSDGPVLLGTDGVPGGNDKLGATTYCVVGRPAGFAELTKVPQVPAKSAWPCATKKRALIGRGPSACGET